MVCIILFLFVVQISVGVMCVLVCAHYQNHARVSCLCARFAFVRVRMLQLSVLCVWYLACLLVSDLAS